MNIHRHVRIVRKPGSAGLMALNADGFHSDAMGKGPVLVDSEISFTGDDFLNVHNRMQVICKPLAPDSLAIIDISPLGDLHSGDTISFWQLEPNCKGGCKTMNGKLGVAVVKSSTQVSDLTTLSECKQSYKNMMAPPYNASLVLKSLSHIVHRVTFTAPLPAAVTATRYNLAQVESRSGAGAVVSRNHFHDGFSRMGLLKALNMTYTDNIVERAGGVHIFSEQEWLEGDLGISNVLFNNNTIIDPTPCGMQKLTAAECLQVPGHFVTVMRGLKNISCNRNTFIAKGQSQPAGTGHPGYCQP